MEGTDEYEEDRREYEEGGSREEDDEHEDRHDEEEEEDDEEKDGGWPGSSYDEDEESAGPIRPWSVNGVFGLAIASLLLLRRRRRRRRRRFAIKSARVASRRRSRGRREVAQIIAAISCLRWDMRGPGLILVDPEKGAIWPAAAYVTAQTERPATGASLAQCWTSRNGNNGRGRRPNEVRGCAQDCGADGADFTSENKEDGRRGKCNRSGRVLPRGVLSETSFGRVMELTCGELACDRYVRAESLEDGTGLH